MLPGSAGPELVLVADEAPAEIFGFGGGGAFEIISFALAGGAFAGGFDGAGDTNGAAGPPLPPCPPVEPRAMSLGERGMASKAKEETGELREAGHE